MIPGLTGTCEMIVKEEDLISRSKGLAADVLSTPRLIQLMETAALNAIQDLVFKDQITLWTDMKVKQLAATPPGMKVTANALLQRVEGNRLYFLVSAHDEKEKVAEGEHERVIASKDPFFQKVKNKRTT